MSQKRIILLILMIFSLPLISGLSLRDGLNNYWPWDVNISGDDKGNNTLTAGGDAARTTTGCKLGAGCATFDGTGDYLYSGPTSPPGNWTASGWFYFTAFDSNPYNGLFTKEADFTTASFAYANVFGQNGANQYLGWNVGAPAYWQVSGDLNLNANTWYYVTFIYNGNKSQAYLNGSLVMNYSGQIVSDNTARWNFGKWTIDANNGDLTGLMDDWLFYTRAITQDEINALYNNGAGCNPLTNSTACGTIAPPVAPTNNSIEAVTEAHQTGTVTIGSTSFVNVLTGEFNVSANVSNYVAWNSNIQYLSNNPNTVTCQVIINGDPYNSTKTRTNPATGGGVYGSISGTSRVFNFTTTQTLNASFQCRASGVQNFQILNSNFVVHQLADSYGNSLNFVSQNYSGTFNTPTYTDIITRQFTTSNKTLGDGQELSIVVSSDITYTYAATNNITSEFIIKLANGSGTPRNCSELKRYGSLGSVISESSNCMLEGADPSGLYNITLMAKGNGDISGSFIVKEFLTNATETQYTRITSPITTSSTSYVNITTLNLTTQSTQDIFFKVDASVTGTTNQRIDFRLIMSNENGSEMYRTVAAANQPGIPNFKDVFKLLTGYKQVTLQARTSTGTASINDADLTAYYARDSPYLLKNVNVTARNQLNGSMLNNFSIFLADGREFSDSGTGNIILTTSESTISFIIGKEGYINTSHTGVTVANSYIANITQPGIYTTSYSGYVTYLGNNYTRELTINNYYACLPNSEIYLVVNSIQNATVSLICDGTFRTRTTTYTHGYEAAYNLQIFFNTSYFNNSNNKITGPVVFFEDLYNPAIQQNISIPEGFAVPTANVSLKCVDNIYPGSLLYQIYQSNYTYAIFYGNKTNGSTQINTTTLFQGINEFTFECSDPFGTAINDTTLNINTAFYILINEITGGLFDITNASSAILYYDDNHSYYNFKTAGTTNISFTSSEDVKLRLELVYYDGRVVTRYIDNSLISGTVRICADTDDRAFYQIPITSTSSQPIVMLSVLANCLIDADYTRFSYDNGYFLNAITTETQYYLYTFNDAGDQILLSTIDGSIAKTVSLDTLQALTRVVDVTIITDSITISKYDSNSTTIFYTNPDETNVQARMIITREDTDQVLLNTTAFFDPTSISVLFDFSTLPNVNGSTIFKVTVIGHKTTGPDTTTTAYFTIGGAASRGISPGIAFVIALFILIFGLSLASAETTFSYFGNFILLGAIAVCAFATQVWYIIFMEGIIAILFIYVTILSLGKYQERIGA